MQKSINTKISVITVNYNVAKHVNNLIKSLHLIDDIIQEIIVIDNNSNDFRNLIQNKKTKIIKNKINYGFAKAVNQAISISKSNIVLLINPDCFIKNKSILISIKEIIKDKNIGAIGGKLRIPNSKKYHFTANSKANFLTGLVEFTILKRFFPNNKITKKFWIEKSRKIIKPTKVESLCGAFIILRKKLNNKLNLFDEKYFLYLEDMEFGNKINNSGFKVIFDPRSEIFHIGGESSNSKYRIVHSHWYKSREIYFKNHLNKIQFVILKLVFSVEKIILNFFNPNHE